jgi:S-(hydroxymethyl)glutathione dehydrogenase/alcohol dehydrogenase
MPAIATRGAVFHGPDRPATVEPLLLDDPRPGELRVRMVASGVCRSDLHVIDGEWARPTDVVLGHEGAAIVEALGPGVPERATDGRLDTGGLRVGDLVVLAWTAPCGRCIACRRGEAWLCADPRGAGHRLAPDLVRLRRPDGTPIGAYSGIGTFGERQVVAAEAAIPVDPRTPPEIAALVGCAVTTGVGAVINTADVRPGDSVVVIGAGGVGLSAIMAAHMRGADPLLLVDPAEGKRAMAVDVGATHSATPVEARAVVHDLTRAGADHVLDAIGLVETVELAIDLTRPGGTTTLVGMTPMGHRASFDVYRFVEDGKRLLGSNYGSAVPARDFPRICSLYLDGGLPLDLLVTEIITLDDLEAAFDAMRRGDGARRVVVHGDRSRDPLVGVRQRA